VKWSSNKRSSCLSEIAQSAAIIEGRKCAFLATVSHSDSLSPKTSRFMPRSLIPNPVFASFAPLASALKLVNG